MSEPRESEGSGWAIRPFAMQDSQRLGYNEMCGFLPMGKEL